MSRLQPPPPADTSDRTPSWLVALLVSLVFTGVLWIGEVADQVTPGSTTNAHGIVPRSGEGLLGIVWSPLLHGGYGHLSANTLPVLVLLFLTLVGGVGRGLLATAVIWVLGGLGVWLTAPAGTVTVGASGLVFGWVTYLVVRGFVNRRLGQVLLGVVVLAIYGGLLWGVLPGTPGVSWQAHLFGAVGGVVAAFTVTDRRPRRTARDPLEVLR